MLLSKFSLARADNFCKMSDKYCGRLDAESCALLVCDMQQKFFSVILHFDEIAGSVLVIKYEFRIYY